jgi:threonine/homoserine/homoserine lactone efflux protein
MFMKKLWVALTAYVLLALLAWSTLPDQRIRLFTLVLLFLLAFKTLLHGRREAQKQEEEPDSE